MTSVHSPRLGKTVVKIAPTETIETLLTVSRPPPSDIRVHPNVELRAIVPKTHHWKPFSVCTRSSWYVSLDNCGVSTSTRRATGVHGDIQRNAEGGFGEKTEPGMWSRVNGGKKERKKRERMKERKGRIPALYLWAFYSTCWALGREFTPTLFFSGTRISLSTVKKKSQRGEKSLICKKIGRF